MRIFDEGLERIERGIKGLNKGLPMGFDRLVEYVPDIQPSTYYLVGGETSSGKTAFADNCFVYNPIDFILSNQTNLKLKIFYYSFEIEKTIKIIKSVGRKIYLDYGLLLDVNYILSKGKNHMSQEHFEIVKKYRNYYDKMEDLIVLKDISTNPTGIYTDLYKHSEENGKWYPTEHGHEYVPNDPNLITLIIVDHIGLLKKEQGLVDKKSRIDKLSEQLIYLRNKCGFSPVLLSQFNRSISSTDRFKLERVLPQLSDFKDSSNPAEDCNISFGLFSPARYEIDDFRGYDIRKLKNRFRSLSILKNRDGESDKVIGLKFIGEVGHYEELPRAVEMTEKDYR